MTKPVTDKTPKISDKRPQITSGNVLRASEEILQTTSQRLLEKGAGAWLSRHEALGMIDEEYDELLEAVRDKSLGEVKKELIDIAVGCLFGIACINQGEFHW